MPEKLKTKIGIVEVGNPPCTDCKHQQMCKESVTKEAPYGIACIDYRCYCNGTRRFPLRRPNAAIMFELWEPKNEQNDE